MKKTLKTFNELLKGNQTVCIACIEDRTEWTISPKDTVEQFIEAIVNACNDAHGVNAEWGDERECKVLNVNECDYGYAIEVKISIPVDNNKRMMSEIYLYHANKF